MFKKSFKYLLIASVNLLLLTGLLALWTDKLELLFNGWTRPKEFLKIIGFSMASLIAMRMLVDYFRRRNITATSLKIKMAMVLTFLVSSYLYIDYSIKTINNVIINRAFRNQLADKIKPVKSLNGTKAELLTFKEYQQITKMYRFPEIPGESTNIRYEYDYDGFLPDYLFVLTYDVPIQVKVDTINYQKGDFSKSQSFEIADNVKRVTYSESKQ